MHNQITSSYQINWCNNLVTSMNSGELAKDVIEAEDLLEVHNQRKVS